MVESVEYSRTSCHAVNAHSAVKPEFFSPFFFLEAPDWFRSIVFPWGNVEFGLPCGLLCSWIFRPDSCSGVKMLYALEGMLQPDTTVTFEQFRRMRDGLSWSSQQSNTYIRVAPDRASATPPPSLRRIKRRKHFKAITSLRYIWDQPPPLSFHVTLLDIPYNNHPCTAAHQPAIPIFPSLHRKVGVASRVQQICW